MSTSTPYDELSGIFDVQKNYLYDLYSTVSPDALKPIDNLRGNLDAAYKAYQTAVPSADAVLDKQMDMYNIISNEAKRLVAKKNSVDSALYGQKRMAQFSDSYSKKYFAQIKILFIIIVVLLIYLGLNMLDSFIPFPSGVFMFIMIFICISAFFVIMVNVKDIMSRYNMDFDKLDLRAPSSMEITGNINGNTAAVGLNSLSCVGEACCSGKNQSGPVWDSTNNKCIIGNNQSGFTLMSQETFLEPNKNVKGNVNPYEPSEINSYTKI
jgi:hypothetical protein